MIRHFLSLSLLLAASLCTSVASGADGPQASVRESTDKLLARLVEIQPLYATDPEAFFKSVDESLAPYVDFDGFSRAVMAKFYRNADDDQRRRFSEKFRDALIRTYAKALVEFDNQEVVVLEPGARSDDREDRASVDLEIHGKDGSIYPVEYSMVLIDGEWKVRNVVINGINMGLQFKSQFTSYMQQYGNNIDRVIENWNVSSAE